MPVLLTNREYVTYNLVFKRYIICTFSSLILFKIVYNDYLLTNPKNGLTIQIKERYYLFWRILSSGKLSFGLLFVSDLSATLTQIKEDLVYFTKAVATSHAITFLVDRALILWTSVSCSNVKSKLYVPIQMGCSWH